MILPKLINFPKNMEHLKFKNLFKILNQNDAF